MTEVLICVVCVLTGVVSMLVSLLRAAVADRRAVEADFARVCDAVTAAMRETAVLLSDDLARPGPPGS